jgi:hypothetical protein
MKTHIKRDDVWLGLLTVVTVALLILLGWRAMLEVDRYMQTLSSDRAPQHERP